MDVARTRRIIGLTQRTSHFRESKPGVSMTHVKPLVCCTPPCTLVCDNGRYRYLKRPKVVGWTVAAIQFGSHLWFTSRERKPVWFRRLKRNQLSLYSIIKQVSRSCLLLRESAGTACLLRSSGYIIPINVLRKITIELPSHLDVKQSSAGQRVVENLSFFKNV